mmetsp:Transcript_8178/g.17688  ORF Transcript_8178/g.17688 Transcript_8178/m.17688 type:complete len:224 (+) Transcript_8178:378-1049(+)
MSHMRSKMFQEKIIQIGTHHRPGKSPQGTVPRVQSARSQQGGRARGHGANRARSSIQSEQLHVRPFRSLFFQLELQPQQLQQLHPTRTIGRSRSVHAGQSHGYFGEQHGFFGEQQSTRAGERRIGPLRDRRSRPKQFPRRKPSRTHHHPFHSPRHSGQYPRRTLRGRGRRPDPIGAVPSRRHAGRELQRRTVGGWTGTRRVDAAGFVFVVSDAAAVRGVPRGD